MYSTNIAALNVVHEFSTEQVRDTSEFATSSVDGSLQGVKEKTAELLRVLLYLHLLLRPAK
jgi:hypothetical protein